MCKKIGIGFGILIAVVTIISSCTISEEGESIKPTATMQATSITSPTITPAPTIMFKPIIKDTPTLIPPTATTRPPTSTPRPPTPMPKPTVLPIGQSRENPIPFGQPFLASDGMEITVLGVKADAWPDIQDENQFNEPPKEGNRFTFILVRVKNVKGGSEAKRVSEADFELVGSSNKIFKTYEDSCGVTPNELEGEIFEGGIAEGNTCYQIPRNESNLILIYEPAWSFNIKPVYFATE